MSFCPNCGSQIPDGAIFCPACGKSTSSGGAHTGNVSGQPYVPTYSPDTDTYSPLSIVGFILSFFIAVAGLIVSVIALNNAKEVGSKKSAAFARAGMIISIVELSLAVVTIIGLYSCYACIIIYGA